MRDDRAETPHQHVGAPAAHSIPEQAQMALIVAIHRGGGMFSFTRGEYLAALEASGAMPGMHAQIHWHQDSDSCVMSFIVDGPKAIQ